MTPSSQFPAIRGTRQLLAVIERDFDNDPDQLVNAIDREISRLLRVDLREAAHLLQTFERLAGLLSKEYRPRVDAAKGRLAHWSGKYQDALTHYLRALKAYEQTKDSLNAARTRRGLMDVYMYLGRYNEALVHGKKALTFFQRKKMSGDAAQVMTNIGNIYHRMDANRQALRYYDKARAVFAPLGGMPLALVEYNRANVYANLNDFDRAHELYQYAAGLYRDAGMGLAQTQATYSLAYLYFLENRFTEAISILEQVHDKFESYGDAKSAAVTNLDQVEIDLHLNQYGSAVLLGRRLTELFRQLGMRYEEAKIYYFIAWANIKLGDFRPASKALQSARVLFVREGNKLWLGVVEVAYSQMYLGRHQPLKAAERAKQAIRLFLQSGDERRRIDAELVWAEAVWQSGNTRLAIGRIKQLLKAPLVTYQRFSAAQLAGNVLYGLSRYDEALVMFREAVQQVERMLRGLYPDEVQFFFVLDKVEAYNMLVDCQLKLGKVDSALSTTLIGLQTVNSQKISNDRLKREIPQELIDTRERLRALMRRSTMNPGDTGSARGQTSPVSVEQRVWANERRIRSKLYERHDLSPPTPIKISDIQALLRDNEVLLTPVLGPGSLGVFRTTRSENRFIPYSITKAELQVFLRKVHFLFEKSVLGWRADELTHESIDFYLKQLYDLLIRPVSLPDTTNSLIVLLQDIFAQVPFAALLDPSGEPLASRLTVQLALTPDSIAGRTSSQVEFLRRQNAVFGVSSELLPQIDAEVEDICRRFKTARLFSGRQATVSRLAEHLKDADGFVHIAAHASRSSENPLFSRILLSDGPLFPFDLFEGGVGAALVTLSGCQTAAPGLYYGNSFSLARAFYLAGCRFVLASLWPVSDKLSMIFMTEFYAALQQDSDIFAAYRLAVRKARCVDDNPAHWGAFILLGI